MRDRLRSLRVTIDEFFDAGDRIAERHFVDVETKEGERARAEVIALWRVRGGQFVECVELTRQVAGSEELRDLGSRAE